MRKNKPKYFHSFLTTTRKPGYDYLCIHSLLKIRTDPLFPPGLFYTKYRICSTEGSAGLAKGTFGAGFPEAGWATLSFLHSKLGVVERGRVTALLGRRVRPRLAVQPAGGGGDTLAQ